MQFDFKVKKILESTKTDIIQLIYEGYYDPAIFKAVFIIGGTGSGKTFITNKLGLPHLGFVQLNSDYPFEKYMEKEGLDMKMPSDQREQRDMLRDKAMSVSNARADEALHQRLGVYIDGTGSDKEETINFDKELKSMGYETAMVFVNTNLETALFRNKKRERTVPEEIAKQKWQEVQSNIGFYQNYFKRNFFVIDNSEGMTEETSKQLNDVYKNIMLWSKQKPANPIAIKEIQRMGREKGIKNP
jgi:adenylate kinase family enzyme